MNDYCLHRAGCKLGKNVKLRSSSISMDARLATTPRSAPLWRFKRTPASGSNCKISSHTFVCEGVTIEDDVFIGHGVTFINDSYPRATAQRTAADRAGLESGAHPCETRSLDWFRSHDPCQRCDWRKRHRRRWQRGDQGRAGKHHRGWQSGKSAPSNSNRAKEGAMNNQQRHSISGSGHAASGTRT